jgi:hypothetical protein
MMFPPLNQEPMIPSQLRRKKDQKKVWQTEIQLPDIHGK